MSRCVCEYAGPYLQRPLHEFHEGVARMVREQRKRAARYIAAINDRRRVLAEHRFTGAPHPALLRGTDSAAVQIAGFASRRIAGKQSQEARRV